MATYTLALSPHQFFDDSGNPLAAGRVYTYESGTSTPLTTYKTSSGTSWGAYVQLDSAGRPENGEIYLEPGLSYKWIIQTSAGVVIDTIDPIAAVPRSAANVDIAGTPGENLSAGEVAYISAGDGALVAGSWYKGDADNAYSSTVPVMAFVVNTVESGGDGVFRTDGQIELVGLTPGADYYVSTTAGAITTVAPANARFVGRAQSTTLLAIAINPPQSGLDLFQIRALI